MSGSTLTPAARWLGIRISSRDGSGERGPYWYTGEDELTSAFSSCIGPPVRHHHCAIGLLPIRGQTLVIHIPLSSNFIVTVQLCSSAIMAANLDRSLDEILQEKVPMAAALPSTTAREACR